LSPARRASRLRIGRHSFSGGTAHPIPRWELAFGCVALLASLESLAIEFARRESLRSNA
jgi:hypothetical protein